MALDPKQIPVNIAGTLDTKTDDKSTLATNFTEMENCNYTRDGALTKRYGFLPKTRNIHGGSTISSLNALTTFEDTELLGYSQNTLYTYSEAYSEWFSKGNISFGVGSEQGIFANGEVLGGASFATFGGKTCYVFERVATGSTVQKVYVRIIDETTKTVLATHEITDTGARTPVVQYFDDCFIIFYTISASSDTLVWRKIALATPETLSGSTALDTAVNLGFHDALTVGSRLYYSYSQDAGQVIIGYFNSSAGSTATANVEASTGLDELTTLNAENGNIRISWYRSGNYRTRLYDANLSSLHSAVTVFTPSGSGRRIVGYQNPSSSTQTILFAESANDLLVYSVTSTGTVTQVGSTPLFYQVAIQSKPISYNSNIYISVMPIKGNSLINTFFLVDWNGNIISQFGKDAGVMGTTGQSYRAPTPLILSGSTILGSGAEIAEVQTADGAVKVSTTIRRFETDLSATNNYFDAQLGPNLHIVGGVLKNYDSNAVVEHGFLEAPKVASPAVAAANAGTAGPTQGQTYGYAYVYAWRDAAGQIHRSAVGFETVDTTVGGSPTDIKVTLSITSLTMSTKTNVEIEVYRTEAAGSIYYKISTHNTSEPLFNDKTTPFATFVDDVPDDAITSNEILYTTGGVLDNDAPEPSIAVATFKSRVVLLLADANTLQYSKIRSEGNPVEFSAEYKLEIDSFGGPGTQLAVMDDNLIILKQRALYLLSGEGPNNLGEQNDFRKPALITSDCGCVDPNSVVAVPEGIMFKSEKGIYVLKRNLAVEYVGEAVEVYNGLTITSATLITDVNQVRFTTNDSGGRALVFDYVKRKWSTYTNFVAVDAVMYGNVYCHAMSTGYVNAETALAYSDNGTFIKMKFVTAWIQLAGILGFQRFRKLQLIGKYKGPHSFTTSFGYNFDPTYVDTATINAGTLLGAVTGGAGPYGNPSFAGAFPDYTWEIRPKRQKCDAFRFKFEDNYTDTIGESLIFSAFGLEVGVKKGPSKQVKATGAAT